MLRLSIFGGGEVMVPPTSIKDFSFNGANVVLNYTDGTNAVLIYVSFDEMNIPVINEQ